MTTQAQEVLINALKLSHVERAELVEKILASFSFPDRKAIDELWIVEVEDRLDAFEKGDLKSRSVSEVFNRIERGEI
jgi:putative addiction module component (TIGR02574 family)